MTKQWVSLKRAQAMLHIEACFQDTKLYQIVISWTPPLEFQDELFWKEWVFKSQSKEFKYYE